MRDILAFAASGGYSDRRANSTRERAAAMSKSQAVRVRKPVPGSRTVHRLKVQSYTQGLAHDPDTGKPSREELAESLGLPIEEVVAHMHNTSTAVARPYVHDDDCDGRACHCWQGK